MNDREKLSALSGILSEAENTIDNAETEEGVRRAYEEARQKASALIAESGEHDKHRIQALLTNLLVDAAQWWMKHGRGRVADVLKEAA